MPERVFATAVGFAEDGEDVLWCVIEREEFVGECKRRGKHVDGLGGEVMNLNEDSLSSAELVLQKGWCLEVVESANGLKVGVGAVGVFVVVGDF